MYLTPHQSLEPGASVTVGGKVGTVIKCEVMQAYPTGLINVHTIKLTHKRIRVCGNQYKTVEIKPEVIKPNYSSVFVNR